MGQIRWDVERAASCIRERSRYRLLRKDDWGDDPMVVKRTFAKADLTGARFEISCAVWGYITYRVGVSCNLYNSVIDNRSEWTSVAVLTCLGQLSNQSAREEKDGYSQIDLTTPTMTTGDIADSDCTIAFMFHLTDWTYVNPQGVHVMGVRVMESDGAEKWFASVDGVPIVELAGDRYQIFNNEDQSVYFSTRNMEYSQFYEKGADQNKEFRLVNAKGTEISVTDISAVTSAQADAAAWASVKTATPISVNGGQSTVISVQVKSSDASTGAFFFVLKATYNG